jgi:hypothetical protein
LSAQEQPGAAAGPGQGAGQPSEDQLRAAYEAELARMTTTDMIAQSAVSLLNLGARRLVPTPSDDPNAANPAERDLEQARDAIDGVKALLEILERRIPQELGPLRDALSRLQMAYARELQSVPTHPSASTGEQASAAQPAAGAQQPTQTAPPGSGKPGPGPAESSGRLWVPGR